MYTVRSIIYYGLLKRRQKSSLNPFPSPDGSFDCSRHTVFLGTNFIEKDFDFDFLAQKYEKNSVFRVSTPTICPTDCGWFFVLGDQIGWFFVLGGFWPRRTRIWNNFLILTSVRHPSGWNSFFLLKGRLRFWQLFLKIRQKLILNRIFSSDHILDSCGSEESFMIKIIEKNFYFCRDKKFLKWLLFANFSNFSIFSKIHQKSSWGQIFSSDGIFGIWDIMVF